MASSNFRIRLVNLFSCQVCNQCLWSTTTVFTTMVLLQSVPVYLQQLCIYVYIVGATVYLQMSVFFHIDFMMVSCNGPQKGV